MHIEFLIYVLCITLVGFLLLFYFFIYGKQKDSLNKRRLDFVTNTAAYIVTLEHFMAKAYDIIYKEYIMIYSLEATKIPNKEFEKAIKAFIELTLKMIGPSLSKELVDFFGNEDTLFFNISEYFTVRYEQDEVRKSATEELMQQEEI